MPFATNDLPSPTTMANRVPRDKRRLRVVHVAQQLQIGGMEKLLVEFARHVDRQRFDLRFLSLSSRGGVAEEIAACGWPVTALEELNGLRPALIWRLARIFRRERVDVVHTHNIKPHLYSVPAAKLAGVPAVIQTRHGQSYQASWRRITAFRLAALFTNYVVCVSHDSRARSARLGIARQKLCTVWNGIDIASFPYQGPSPQGPVVTVARLSPEKDIPTLIRAAALAAARNPSFRLEIAGDGPCQEELERLVADLGLSGHVRLLGKITDVPGLLARSSLFVLPSLTEGVSLTLLEAMAAGLPVVATAVGGTPEVVLEGKTGWLVAPGNPEAMAARMCQVLDNPALGQSMGRQGHERVKEHFDVRRMVREYEALYEQCVFG